MDRHQSQKSNFTSALCHSQANDQENGIGLTVSNKTQNEIIKTVVKNNEQLNGRPTESNSVLVDLCSPYPNASLPSFERFRMQQQRVGLIDWALWGPYLAARQWGTVQEPSPKKPNSNEQDFWHTALSYKEATSVVFENGEDGLFGVSDSSGRLCFGYALWNHRDSILKERLFGLTNPEGNHGEDVKEVYAYLKNLPSHAYMQARYIYPQRKFPYEELYREARQRGRSGAENKLEDTGILQQQQIF